MNEINPYLPPQGDATAELSRIDFSKEDEHVISSTGLLMIVAGLANLITGAVTIAAALVTTLRIFQELGAAGINVSIISPIVISGISALIGIFMIMSGAAFHKLARTDIADQAYLSSGFSRLRLVFLFKTVSIIISIVATLFASLVAFF